MTHRVQALIQLEIGRAETAIFWMRNPSDEAIQVVLRKRGVMAGYNLQLIEI
jgi:hypothetical protein